jgi:hypothetical protein
LGSSRPIAARLDGRSSALATPGASEAAVTAQIATAIAILTFAPIRLGNLIQIKLDENLIKSGALDDPYWLVFPHYDVKNRVRLQFKLVPQLCAIIDEYIHDHRSVLLRGSNAPWLFRAKQEA